MEFNIIGNVVPSVEVSLTRGESMFTQSGRTFHHFE